MDSEIHLFIIWEKARNMSDRIIEDIKSKFTILKIYEITWSAENYNSNLIRFYRRDFSQISKKKVNSGTGPFLLVVVKDEIPSYGFRKSPKDLKYVNIKMCDSKNLFRDWTDWHFKVHGTYTQNEARNDLILLLGISPNDFLRENPFAWNGEITKLKRDLVGANGWDSIEQLFYVLNNTCNYVVLRNYECLPKKYLIEGHGDIDILTDDHVHFAHISNAVKKNIRKKQRINYTIKIDNQETPFDLWDINTQYYCHEWSRNILNTKIFLPSNVYAPNTENYFFSLLYHALIHKNSPIEKGYIDKLVSLSQQINFFEFEKCLADGNLEYLKMVINAYVISNGYKFTQPTARKTTINTKNIIGYNKRYFAPIITAYKELKKHRKKLSANMKKWFKSKQD